jgi:hypothetical protein
VAEEHEDAEPVVECSSEHEGQWGSKPRGRERQKGVKEQDIHNGAEATNKEIAQELDRERRVRHVVAHNAVERAESVLRANLLAVEEDDATTESPRWSWTRLLKRVFALDMATCPFCRQGSLRIIAAITQAEVIRKILRHLKRAADPPPIVPARARQATFGWVA